MRGRKLPPEIRNIIQTPTSKADVALSKSHHQSDYVSTLGGYEAVKDDVGGLLNIAIEIAAERRKLLGAIKTALEHRDQPEVIRLVSKLCGANDEESSGTDSSID